MGFLGFEMVNGNFPTISMARNPLVMTNSLPWKPWPIEIEGLPFLIAW